eukprot:4406196-Amphidinium_carterae.1
MCSCTGSVLPLHVHDLRVIGFGVFPGLEPKHPSGSKEVEMSEQRRGAKKSLVDISGPLWTCPSWHHLARQVAVFVASVPRVHCA